VRQGGKLATVKAVADLQAHWLQAMEAVDFINPDKPKKVVQRLARMLAKTPLEQEEVDMLRGFFSDVIRVVDNRLYPHEFERKKP
jgi:tRNA/rRNA methyltransferase